MGMGKRLGGKVWENSDDGDGETCRKIVMGMRKVMGKQYGGNGWEYGDDLEEADGKIVMMGQRLGGNVWLIVMIKVRK